MRASIPMIERGRGDVVVRQIQESWGSFSGHAIEPLIRHAIQSLLPAQQFGNAEYVGAYWNRDGSVEIDVVGGPDPATSAQIAFVGSIKWRDTAKLDNSDVEQLIAHRALLPGADAQTLLVGVSRTGFTTDRLDVALTAEDILAAGQPRASLWDR